MFNFYLILIMLFSSISTHSAYIDTRDMSSESARIQRLLGQLETLHISTSQKSSSSLEGSKLAMLAMMTTGLAVASSSSSYRRYGYKPPVKTYHKPYYYRPPSRPSKDAATAIGTTMAVVGAIALAVSEAEIEREQQLENQRQETLQKVEKEINSIISNLVSTDTDYISENKALDEKLSYTVDKNILDIAATTSNEIQLLLDKEEKMSSDFINATNRLSAELFEFEKHITEAMSYNINMMDGSSKDKELKRLNSSLEKNMQTKQKDVKKQIDTLTKDFNKNFPKVQEQNKALITKLKNNQNANILKEVDNAATHKSKLFQEYIDKYIQKLAVY